MRLAIERLTAPLWGWIPDITAAPRSRQALVGIAGSALLHLLLLLVLTLLWSVMPKREERAPMAPEANLELTVLPQIAPEPVPQTKPDERKFVDANGLKEGEKPKEADFEADRDMTAGSELPARGESPLPTQDGEQLPFMRDFANQDITMQADNFATAAQTSPAEAPQPPAEPQAATVAPLYAPQPVSKEALAAADKAPPQEKLPEPAKPTRATPAPLRKVTEASPEELAFATKAPEPTPAAPPVPNAPETPQVKPAPNPYANWSTPQPITGPSIAERYKEEMRKTKNEGVITKQGVMGVNAINTPAGRWRKRMFEAMRQNWELFVRQNPDLLTLGSVRVKFYVGPTGGRASDIRVHSDQGNNTSAQISLRAVSETPIPAPPPDMFKDLQGEKLEAEVVFTLY